MHAAPHEVLFARSEHGSFPIRVIPQCQGRRTFEVLSANVVRARYTSAYHLIAALTLNPRHRFTFDQYFGRKEAHPSFFLPHGGSTLDLFAPVQPTARPIRTQQVALTVGEPVLGIDLRARGHEVRKLLFAGFGSRIMRSGYDPEEVLQEVYRGILTRNGGKCPFDVRKSSFGHYVHMVCECVLNNYHRREARRREVEQVGMSAPAALREDAGLCGTVDAAVVAERMGSTLASGTPSSQDGMDEALRRLGGHIHKKRQAGIALDTMSVQIAELLVGGMNRREIAGKIGIPQSRVTTAINLLREHVLDWA